MNTQKIKKEPLEYYPEPVAHFSGNPCPTEIKIEQINTESNNEQSDSDNSFDVDRLINIKIEPPEYSEEEEQSDQSDEESEPEIPDREPTPTNLPCKVLWDVWRNVLLPESQFSNYNFFFLSKRKTLNWLTS